MKIGITNLKGGVGKTTLSINLAVCFAHMGYKVCIVDTDTNQNSLAWYGIRPEGVPEIMVVGATDVKALHKAVNNLHDGYDVVIMDGTPNLGEMNTRVIMASDLLLIPTRPGAHDYRAMQEFMNRLDQVREMKDVVVAAFVINEYDERYVAHRTVKESLKDFDVPVLKNYLKSRTSYGEANFFGNGVFELSDVKAKDEIINLTTEIIALAEQHNFISN
jgi:chromosome partitioning protein